MTPPQPIAANINGTFEILLDSHFTNNCGFSQQVVGIIRKCISSAADSYVLLRISWIVRYDAGDALGGMPIPKWRNLPAFGISAGDPFDFVAYAPRVAAN